MGEIQAPNALSLWIVEPVLHFEPKPAEAIYQVVLGESKGIF